MKFNAAFVLLACSHGVYAGKLRTSVSVQPEANASSTQLAKISAHADGNSAEKQMPQKVTMQISDAEVNSFLGKLSPDCKSQYSSMFNGKGSDLHTFGSPGQATAESCNKLQGALCDTRAHVVQQSTNSSGRSMHTTVEMKGNGCLPKACIAKHDLVAVATFMHKKAQGSGQIPGQGVDLNLHVDCTKSGGSVADAYMEEPKGDDDDDSDDKHEDAHAEPKEEHHEEKHDEHHETKEEHHEEKQEDHHEEHVEEHHKADDHAKSAAFESKVATVVTSIGVIHLLA